MAERIIDWNDHTATTSATLQAARTRRGDAPEAVAREAGLSPVHYSKLERGEALDLPPRADAIERLCAALAIDPGDLLPLPWKIEDVTGLPDPDASA